MPIQLNVFQEVFLVSFSILYGIMLQTFFGVNPFPWSKIRLNTQETAGLKNDKIILIRRKLVASIVFLNIFPFLYAVVILCLLNSFIYECWDLNSYVLIFQTLVAGLSVFGFQRLYGVLIVTKKKYFPKMYGKLKNQLKKDVIEQKEFEWKNNTAPKIHGYFYSTLYYIIAPLFSIIWSAYFQNPLVGLAMWIVFMIVILSFMFSKKNVF